VAAFQKEFPATLLKVRCRVERRDRAGARRALWVGVVASLRAAPPQLTRERLLAVRTPILVSPQHPLAAHRAADSDDGPREHIQLVHADPLSVASTVDSGLLSPRSVAFISRLPSLRCGTWFGIMPLHMIEADLATGAASFRSRPSPHRLRATSSPCRPCIGLIAPGTGRALVHRPPQTGDARWLKGEGALSAAAPPSASDPPSRSLTMIRSLSSNGSPAVVDRVSRDASVAHAGARSPDPGARSSIHFDPRERPWPLTCMPVFNRPEDLYAHGKACLRGAHAELARNWQARGVVYVALELFDASRKYDAYPGGASVLPSQHTISTFARGLQDDQRPEHKSDFTNKRTSRCDLDSRNIQLSASGEYPIVGLLGMR